MTATKLRWEGTHLISAPTNNRTLRKHWAERSGVTHDIRKAFWALAVEHGNRAPRFSVPVKITAQPTFNRGAVALPDTDGSALAVKAAIDGLVDARVIVDDGPDQVAAVVLLAPRRGDHDGLTITVEPWS